MKEIITIEDLKQDIINNFEEQLGYIKNFYELSIDFSDIKENKHYCSAQVYLIIRGIRNGVITTLSEHISRHRLPVNETNERSAKQVLKKVYPIVYDHYSKKHNRQNITKNLMETLTEEQKTQIMELYEHGNSLDMLVAYIDEERKF